MTRLHMKMMTHTDKNAKTKLSKKYRHQDKENGEKDYITDDRLYSLH